MICADRRSSPSIIKDFPIDIIDQLPDRFQHLPFPPKSHPLPHDVPVIPPRRHLPQHVRPPVLDARRHRDGSANNSFHALPRERNGFLRPARDPRLIEHVDARARVTLPHEVDDVGVVSPATAHEDLVDVLRGRVALVVVDDGLGCDSSDGRDDVVGRKAFPPTFLDQMVRQRVPEDFSARGFGGIDVEVGMRQHLVDESLVHLSALAHLAVLVVLSFSIGEMSHRGVDEDVTRTGVEVVALVDTASVVWWDEADVGDAPNVLASSKLGRMM